MAPTAPASVTAAARPRRLRPNSPHTAAVVTSRGAPPSSGSRSELSPPPSKRQRTAAQQSSAAGKGGSSHQAATPNQHHTRTRTGGASGSPLGSLLQPLQPPLPIFLPAGQLPVGHRTRGRTSAAATAVSVAAKREPPTPQRASTVALAPTTATALSPQAVSLSPPAVAARDRDAAAVRSRRQLSGDSALDPGRLHADLAPPAAAPCEDLDCRIRAPHPAGTCAAQQQSDADPESFLRSHHPRLSPNQSLTESMDLPSLPSSAAEAAEAHTDSRYSEAAETQPPVTPSPTAPSPPSPKRLHSTPEDAVVSAPMSGAALTSAMHKPDATGLDTYAVAAAVGAGGSIAAETARGRPILRRNSAIWDQRPADEGRKARCNS